MFNSVNKTVVFRNVCHIITILHSKVQPIAKTATLPFYKWVNRSLPNETKTLLLVILQLYRQFILLKTLYIFVFFCYTKNMDEREIIAKNLTRLREANRLTQAELAEKLNYTDKAISKWERAESIPDVLTLKKVATILGVDVNFILEEHDKDSFEQKKKKKIDENRIVITSMSITVTWLIATIVFVYCKIYQEIDLWQVFVAAVPVSCLQIFYVNRKWIHSKVLSFVAASCLQWTLLATIYLWTLSFNTWPIFFIGIPMQIILIFSSRLTPKDNPFVPKNKRSDKEAEPKNEDSPALNAQD